MLRHCIDHEYVAKLLSEAEEALEELRSIASRPMHQVLQSRDLVYAMRFSIIAIVESLSDVAQHILTRCFNTAPKSYAETFTKLGEVEVLSRELSTKLASLAKLRNLIVHRYWLVDDARIYREARDRGIEAVSRAIEELRRAVDD